MKKLRSLTVLTTLAMAAATANAADITWTGATDNNWFTGTNWTPNVPSWSSNDNATVLSGTPTATSNVNINGGGTVLIDGGDVQWSGRFNSIGNGQGGTLILESGSLTVDYDGEQSFGFGVGLIRSAPGAPGVGGLVQQSGGTLNVINKQAEEFNIGRSEFGVGVYELSGGTLNAGLINVSKENGSLGTLEMTGGTLNATDLYIGRDGSANGVVEISGGTVDVGVLVNGSGGTSTLHIIGDDATITSSASGTTLAGFSMFNNFKSTLKLTIDEGISLIDASAGTVGISAPGSNDRNPTLDVEFSVAPQVGDVFDIIKYGTLQPARWDTFSGVVDSPIGENTVTLAIDYAGGPNGDTIQLEVVDVLLSGLSGDYNNSGVVDLADYTIWRNNLGAPAGSLPNDFVGGEIDADQYSAWRANYGASVVTPIASISVPEPSTLVLTLLLGLAFSYRKATS